MDRTRRIILTILAIIGLGLSFELILIFVKNNFIINAVPSFCSVSQLIDCDGVAKTGYSMFLGIPLALWGAMFYSLVLFLTFVDKIAQKFKFFEVFKNPRSYIATLGLIAFLCSISLASISIFEIKKICVLCFVTYFIDLFIALTAATSAADMKNTIVDFFAGVKQYTTLFIAVLLLFIGTLYYTQTSLILSPYAREQRDIGVFMEMKTNPYAILGNVLGNAKSPIKFVAYSDFLCPFCKTNNIMLHKLVKDVPDVEIVHQNFPLDTSCNTYVPNNVHPGACILAKYALSAREQGNYWGMVNLIYDNGPTSEDELLDFAKKEGFDVVKLKKDAYSAKIERALRGQIEMAHENGVLGTPTSIIGGIFYPGGMPYSQLILKVKQAQKRFKRDGKF